MMTFLCFRVRGGIKVEGPSVEENSRRKALFFFFSFKLWDYFILERNMQIEAFMYRYIVLNMSIG